MIGDSQNRDGRLLRRLTDVITLFCGDLFPSTVENCCPDCHRADRNNLISLNPRKDGTSDIDFSLPIQALVCCDCYDAARALPNSVWLAHVEKRGRTRMTGFDRPVYTPALPLSAKPTRGVTESKVGGRRLDDDDAPSMEDFLWSIRHPGQTRRK